MIIQTIPATHKPDRIASNVIVPLACWLEAELIAREEPSLPAFHHDGYTLLTLSALFKQGKSDLPPPPAAGRGRLSGEVTVMMTLRLARSLGNIGHPVVYTCLAKLIYHVYRIDNALMLKYVHEIAGHLCIFLSEDLYKEGIQKATLGDWTADKSCKLKVPALLHVALQLAQRLTPVGLASALRPERDASTSKWVVTPNMCHQAAMVLIRVGTSLLKDVLDSELLVAYSSEAIQQEVTGPLHELMVFPRFARQITQTCLFHSWPLYGVSWNVFPKPDPAAFEAEESTTQQRAPSPLANSHLKGPFNAEPVIILLTGFYAKVISAVSRRNCAAVWELWAPVAQYLSLLCAYGTRLDRRAAMLVSAPFETRMLDWLIWVLTPRSLSGFTTTSQ